MKSPSKPLGRHTSLVVHELQGEILIYDLQSDRAYCLNETAALVWQACDGHTSVVEMAGILTRKLKSPVNEDFVWLALEQLRKENLIENAPKVSTPFAGLTRREIIRKVGLSSLVALPLVSSLVAPTAASAQSGICAVGACRCPNSSTSCNGTAGTFGGITFVNCFSASGGNSACNCTGPFGPPNGAGSGFKAGLGCRNF